MYKKKMNKPKFTMMMGEMVTARALAFYFMLNKRYSKIRTYAEMAKATGVSEATARRHVKVLKEWGCMDMAMDNHVLKFRLLNLKAPQKRLKNGYIYTDKHADIIISDENIDWTNIKTVLTSLRAISIGFKQSKRDFLSRLSCEYNNPRKQLKARDRKALGAKLAKYLHGKTEFKDCGMSFGYLRKFLHCGTKTLQDVLAYGKERDIVERIVTKGEKTNLVRKNEITENWRDFAEDFHQARLTGKEMEDDCGVMQYLKDSISGRLVVGGTGVYLQTCGVLRIGHTLCWC